MEFKTEYAKEQEEKHKRKIILPCVITWEYGSNKYASQKGSASFGTNRNNTLAIKSSKPLSESNDGVVPHITCPPLHWKTPSRNILTMHRKAVKTAGTTPIGAIREQVTKVYDKDGEEKVMISKIVDDKMTETILKKWNRPNYEAKNSDIGKRRNNISESIGGKRMSREDMQKCRAAIPRFQNPSETIAGKDKKNGETFQCRLPKTRQATMQIEGLNRTTYDQLETNRYMAWIGGQVTLQSQARTGGFQKTRDVVSNDYYEKMSRGPQFDINEVRKRLEEERRNSQPEILKHDDIQEESEEVDDEEEQFET
ncbi:hypothetical protein WR25_24937 [Diploscapter pachys]|uniref:Uncharacterized protein n=1 Tax=Diploscapter pachys TaxID=2018661 RepID=A0A2A2J2N8_9BILA|nr:hypothetical protein WR25_24937 [Diploscapter pachys]